MNIKKLAPWNWFKKEEETGADVPVRMGEPKTTHPQGGVLNPILQLHREMDNLFENAFRDFGLPSFIQGVHTPLTASGLLKPRLDIGATDEVYTITVEVPGVREEDITVEVANNTMTIRGEKKQVEEEKDKNYYRVERSYGSFQRILSLPEDAVQEDIKATFKDGVLTIKMNRKTLPEADVKQIEIKSS